jgi:large subunit ribosomal protein L25
MSDNSLKLDERTVEGKRVAKLRKAGIVPSVVYGNVPAPLSTQSEFVATTKLVRAAGRHTPVNLTIGGKKKLAIIKSIDFDPVKHSVRHVAFHAIKQNEKITTEVPIELIGEGESAAEKAGLVVLQAIETLEVKALPANLPESLELSITSLESTEDKLTVADITLPEGVEFADPEQDTSLVVANVYEPSALQAANEAAGGEAEDVSDVEAENGGEVEESPAPATGASDNE